MANTTGRKFGGRKKGTPNKVTEVLRKRVEKILEVNWELFEENMEKLTPKEHVDTTIKLLEYGLPKLNRTELKGVTSVEDYLTLTPKERVQKLKELKGQING